MLRSRSTVSACVANTCWRRRPMRSIRRSTKASGRRSSKAFEAERYSSQEHARAVAALLGELRALERGRDGRGHVELAAPRQLRQARHVHGAQLDRRAAQRPHHRARVVRVGERAQPGEHVAHLGALEVGGGAAGAGGHGALLERGRDHRALALHRAHQHRDPLGRHAARRSAARPRPPRPGPGRARSGQRQKRTRPPLTPRRAVGRGEHRRGRVEDAPARAAVALELHDARLGQLLEEAGVASPRPVIACSSSPSRRSGSRQQHPLGEVRLLVLVDQDVPEAGAPRARARAGARAAAGRRAARGRRSRARRARRAAGRGRRTGARTRARARRGRGRRRRSASVSLRSA